MPIPSQATSAASAVDTLQVEVAARKAEQVCPCAQSCRQQGVLSSAHTRSIAFKHADHERIVIIQIHIYTPARAAAKDPGATVRRHRQRPGTCPVSDSQTCANALLSSPPQAWKECEFVTCFGDLNAASALLLKRMIKTRKPRCVF